MTTETATRRCPRCGETFPATTDHWYFDWLGRVTGYHKACQRAYNSLYWAERATPAQRAQQRASSLAWQRRRRGTPPDRYRAQEAAS